MIRERIGQAALRAYPPMMCRTRGPEMLGMLLDAGEQSRWALVRESGSLVVGGLRERAAITARAGTRRLMADSCCQAVIIILTLALISTLNQEVIAGPSQQLLIQGVALVAILVCALIGYERVAAVGGLAAIAASTHSAHTLSRCCWRGFSSRSRACWSWSAHPSNGRMTLADCDFIHHR
ncbi:MAG TPA: hypothetical protein VGH56_05525 [Solirubrobacteraceae bacterium]